MYLLIPLLIIIFSGLFGLYFLFVESSPALGVHFLLITLYFFLSIYEMMGAPFSKMVYYLVATLLVADGLYFLFFFGSTYLLSGIISLFFAYSAWHATKRVS